LITICIEKSEVKELCNMIANVKSNSNLKREEARSLESLLIKLQHGGINNANV